MKNTYTRRTALAISAGSAIAAASAAIAPRVGAIEPTAPATPQFAPISEQTRKEVSRLVTEALPTDCLAHSFGRPMVRRWVVDRTMERLAAGEGSVLPLEALVREERGRYPSGWTSGRPNLHVAGDVAFGTYSPPVPPNRYWTFEPLGMFVQAEGGEWHYRARTDGDGRDARFQWMIEYVGYGE